MKRLSRKDRNGKSSPLFFAALCMAIAVALFSAVAPLGLPFSRVTGSAFNPATTSVVLKARSPVEAAAAAVHEPDADTSLPPSLTRQAWLLPAAILILGALTEAAIRGRRHPNVIRRRLQPVRSRRARAPPSFS